MSTSLDYGGDLGHEKDDEVEPSDSVWQGDFRFISDEENDFERINLSLEEIQEIRSRSCQNLEEKWNYVESSAESCRDELTKLETIIQQFGSEINSLHDSLSDIELRQREVQAEKNPPFVELDDEKCQSFADVSAPYKSINNNLIIEKGHWDSSYRPTGWQEDSAKSLPPPIQDKDRPPPPCRQSLSDLPKFRHPSIGLLSLRLNQVLVFTPSKPKKRRRRLTLEDFSPELKRLKSDLKVIEDHNLEQRSRNETHSKENLYIYGLPKILCNFNVWAERLTTYGKILDFRISGNALEVRFQTSNEAEAARLKESEAPCSIRWLHEFVNVTGEKESSYESPLLPSWDPLVEVVIRYKLQSKSERAQSSCASCHQEESLGNDGILFPTRCLEEAFEEVLKSKNENCPKIVLRSMVCLSKIAKNYGDRPTSVISGIICKYWRRFILEATLVPIYETEELKQALVEGTEDVVGSLQIKALANGWVGPIQRIMSGNTIPTDATQYQETPELIEERIDVLKNHGALEEASRFEAAKTNLLLRQFQTEMDLSLMESILESAQFEHFQELLRFIQANKSERKLRNLFLRVARAFVSKYPSKFVIDIALADFFGSQSEAISEFVLDHGAPEDFLQLCKIAAKDLFDGRQINRQIVMPVCRKLMESGKTKDTAIEHLIPRLLSCFPLSSLGILIDFGTEEIVRNALKVLKMKLECDNWVAEDGGKKMRALKVANDHLVQKHPSLRGEFLEILVPAFDATASSQYLDFILRTANQLADMQKVLDIFTLKTAFNDAQWAGKMELNQMLEKFISSLRNEEILLPLLPNTVTLLADLFEQNPIKFVDLFFKYCGKPEVETSAHSLSRLVAANSTADAQVVLHRFLVQGIKCCPLAKVVILKALPEFFKKGDITLDSVKLLLSGDTCKGDSSGNTLIRCLAAFHLGLRSKNFQFLKTIDLCEYLFDLALNHRQLSTPISAFFRNILSLTLQSIDVLQQKEATQRFSRDFSSTIVTCRDRNPCMGCFELNGFLKADVREKNLTYNGTIRRCILRTLTTYVMDSSVNRQRFVKDILQLETKEITASENQARFKSRYCGAIVVKKLDVKMVNKPLQDLRVTYRSLKNMIDALSTETSTTPVIQLTQSHAPGSKSNHATSTMGHPGCAASNSSMTPIPRVVAPLVSFRISHLMFGSYRPSLPPTLAPASVRNEGICFQAPVMNDSSKFVSVNLSPADSYMKIVDDPTTNRIIMYFYPSQNARAQILKKLNLSCPAWLDMSSRVYIALVTTQQSTPDFLRILRGVFHDKDSWKKKQAETRHFSDETTTRSASVSSSSLSSSINVPSNPPSSSSSGSSSSQRSRAPSQKRNAPVVISHASNIVVSSLLQCALLPQSQVSKNIAAGPTNNNELATSSSSSNQGVKRRHRLYPVDGEPCAKKLASPVRAPNSSYDTSTSPAASGNISIVTFNDAHLGHRK